jgi:hypothetical protein
MRPSPPKVAPLPKLKRLLSLAVTVACACSGGSGATNTAVTDNGITLQPQSALMFNFTFFTLSVTGVVVTDHRDICSELASRDICAKASAVDGTSMIVLVPGSDPGTFSIGTSSDGGTFYVDPSLEFTSVRSGRVFDDNAVSGKVTLGSFKFQDSATGSYDVAMKSGAHLAGSFSGKYCALFDQAVLNGRSCNTLTGSASCNVDCRCKGKQVKADCSQMDPSSSWKCTCTDARGTTTQCTMEASMSSNAVCNESANCCPLAF